MTKAGVPARSGGVFVHWREQWCNMSGVLISEWELGYVVSSNWYSSWNGSVNDRSAIKKNGGNAGLKK